MIFFSVCVIKLGYAQSTLLLDEYKDAAGQVKALGAAAWAVSWTSCFFHGTWFFLQQMTGRQTIIIQTYISDSGRYSLKNKWCELLTSKKKLTAFVASEEIQAIKWNLGPRENLHSLLWNLWLSIHDFLMRLMIILINSFKNTV